MQTRWPKQNGGILLAFAVGLVIIAIQFQGLFLGGIDENIWGISLSADPVATIGFVHDFIDQVKNGCIGHDTNQNFPFGALIPLQFDLMQNVTFNLFFYLSYFSDHLIASYNASIVLTFLINFMLSFIAFKMLLRDPILALLPATLFTFSAYGHAHAWAHLGMIPVFFFPAFAVCFWRLQTTGMLQWSWASAFCFGLAVNTSPYYGYFTVWMAVAILVGAWWAAKRKYTQAPKLRPNFFCALASFAAGLPFLYQNFLRSGSHYWGDAMSQSNYGQNLLHLMSFSAHPFDYILPNINNFAFGAYFRDFIAAPTTLRNAFSDEFPISIGTMPTFFLGILAFIALTCLLAKFANNVGPVTRAAHWARAPFARLSEEERGLAIVLTAIMVVSFLISLAPRIDVWGLTIYTPNEALRHLLPFRSYSRFAVVFLMALATLMALVLKYQPQKNQWVAAVIAFSIFETTPITYLHSASPETPYLAFLAQRPENVIIRSEIQNTERQRPLDLERIFAHKKTLNGAVNRSFDLVEAALAPDSFSRFNLGHLGQMGAELFIFNGHYDVPAKNAPYLTKIADFSESEIEVWKIAPAKDQRLEALMGPYLEKRHSDRCYVGDKDTVQATIDEFVKAAISGS